MLIWHLTVYEVWNIHWNFLEYHKGCLVRNYTHIYTHTPKHTKMDTHIYIHYITKYFKTLPRRIENLKFVSLTCIIKHLVSNKETFLQYFFEILKRTLQNFEKILKIFFIVTGSLKLSVFSGNPPQMSL